MATAADSRVSLVALAVCLADAGRRTVDARVAEPKDGNGLFTIRRQGRRSWRWVVFGQSQQLACASRISVAPVAVNTALYDARRGQSDCSSLVRSR